MKNQNCHGYAYNKDDAEPCRILDNIDSDRIESNTGWTLYKCTCCNVGNCDTANI